MNIPTQITRRLRRVAVATAALGIAVALTACSASAPEPAPSPGGEEGPAELIDITVGAAPSIFSLAMRAGVNSGFFEEAGFNVDIQTTQSMGEAMPLILDGTYQYIQGDVQNTILAASEGLPVVIGAPNTVSASEPVPNDESFGPLIVQESSGFTDIKDLDGKLVGTNTIGGAAYMDFKQMFDEAGITVEWVEIPGPQQLPSLKQDQVQAVTLAEPNATNAILGGGVMRLANADSTMKGAPNFGWISSQKWVQENPEVAKRFEAAVIEVNKLVLSDRALAEEALASYTELKPEAIAAVNFPHYAQKPFTAKDLKPVADRMVEFGLMSEDKMPDLASLIPSY